MNDATGRELKPGQLIELNMIGMFRGVVTEVITGNMRVAIPGQQPNPPRIQLNVMVQLYADEGGTVRNCYIVADVPEGLREQLSQVDDKSRLS